jgi:hypothetical protein
VGRERRHSEARGMGLKISLLIYADRRAMMGDLHKEQPHPLALRHEGSLPRRAKKLVGSAAEPCSARQVSIAVPC